MLGGGSALPELSRERRYLVLAICCLSLFVVGMDVTIINVALPSIGRDFRAPVSGLQWTVDAYLLVIASLLMLSGSVGDRVGRGRSSRSAWPSSPPARSPARSPPASAG